MIPRWRPRSLKHRTLVGVLVIVALFVLSTVVLTLTHVRQGFHDLEEVAVLRGLDRARRAIDDSLGEMVATATDFATRDAVVAAAAQRDSSALADQFSEGVLPRLKIDAVAVVDRSRLLVFGRHFRASLAPELADLPERLAAAARTHPELLPGVGLTEIRRGFLALDGRVYLYTAAPVLRVGSAGGNTGSLFLLRELSEERIVGLSHITATRLEIVTERKAATMAAEGAALARLSRQSVVIAALGEKTIAGFARLRGINDESNVLLRVELDRAIHERANEMTAWMIGAVVVVGLTLGMFAHSIVNRWVVERARSLGRQLEQISRSTDLDRRVDIKGDDELGDLAASINQLLASLEKMTNELGTEIRERIRTQERLFKANRELEATLQFRQDLSNMLVHDIRSPLTVIDFYLQIQARKQDDRSPDSSLQLAQRSVNRLNQMVNDLLIMAKFEAGKVVLNRTEFDLRGLLTRNLDEVRFLAGKRGVRIRDDFPRDPVVVELDANLIWRVVENLVSNAVKYSPENAAVTVKLERLSLSNFFDQRPEEVLLSVFDEGPGIPAEFQEAIFEKWNVGKLDRSKAQLGLGLSFCRMIVEAQGGRIWVENNEPRGSIFRVSLPRGTSLQRREAPAVTTS